MTAKCRDSDGKVQLVWRSSEAMTGKLHLLLISDWMIPSISSFSVEQASMAATMLPQQRKSNWMTQWPHTPAMKAVP